MSHTQPLPDGRRAIDGGFSCNLTPISNLATCTACAFSSAATIHPTRPFGLLRDCLAPGSCEIYDDLIAMGMHDALCSDLGSARLTAPRPTRLGDGLPASLMPGPASARAALQRIVCTAGWLGRLTEEPRGALALAAVVGAATATFSRRSRL